MGDSLNFGFKFWIIVAFLTIEKSVFSSWVDPRLKPYPNRRLKIQRLWNPLTGETGDWNSCGRDSNSSTSYSFEILIYHLTTDSPKKVDLPPRRSCGDSGGGTRPHRQGLLRHPSVVLPPPEFDAGSPARDEDGRRQGSARILWETRAAGRLPPSPRRCLKGSGALA